MMLTIFEITFPIFAIAILGFIYSKYARPDFAGANKFVMDVALPILVFVSLSSKNFNPATAAAFTGAAILLILTCWLIAVPLTRFSGVSKAAFLPLVMFANVGPVGIPLIALAYGDGGLVYSVILLVVSNLLHFTLGVMSMSGKVDWRMIYASPLVWASVLGILSGVIGVEIPSTLMTTLTMIGNVLVPLMLVSLGARLATSTVSDASVGFRASSLAIVTRVIAAYLIILLMPLSDIERGALILFAFLPPAVFNFMIADKFHVEPQLVASTVIVGHMLGILCLPLGLWLAFV